MGNCLGSDTRGHPQLDQGLMPVSGFMQMAPMDEVNNPHDPWSDWYFDDYEVGGHRDRIESGRWDMSRASFRAKLADRDRIRAGLEASLEPQERQKKADVYVIPDSKSGISAAPLAGTLSVTVAASELLATETRCRIVAQDIVDLTNKLRARCAAVIVIPSDETRKCRLTCHALLLALGCRCSAQRQ